MAERSKPWWVPPLQGVDAKLRTVLMGLASALNPLFAPWQSFAPTWEAFTTNPSLGNGTLVGRYRQVGHTVDWRICLTIGSTTTLGTGGWLFDLPPPLRRLGVAAPTGYLQSAYFTAVDASSSTTYVGSASVNGVIGIGPLLVSGSANSVSASVPFSWANGDTLVIEGRTEGAPTTHSFT